jgi:uncharacterized protein
LICCVFSAIIETMAPQRSSDAQTMLLAFRAENVRSFKDRVEISLEATAMAEPEVVRELPWRDRAESTVRVLPAAGVFGANASGKSNLLRAMDDMRRVVLTSFKDGDRSSSIFRRPFRLDSDYEPKPSMFEVELVLDGVRYEYGFIITDNQVISEWARSYPHGKAANLFRRDGSKISQLPDRNRKKSEAVGEILRDNSLYLSAANAADHPDLVPLYRWFDDNLSLCEASSREKRWMLTTHLLTHENTRGQVLSMLAAADLGVVDAQNQEPDADMLERIRKVLRALDIDDEGLGNVQTFVGIKLSHKGRSGDVDFDTSEESLGTLVWLGLLGPVVQALASGEVLLVDELESSLHPILVAQLVRTFQSPSSNPNGAQLIFNSHEAGLLGNSVDDRVLGRDQVWFTEKLNDGHTRLYPLTDLNPRKAEAIGRRYLAGRYGATPIISGAEFELLTASMAEGSH